MRIFSRIALLLGVALVILGGWLRLTGNGLHTSDLTLLQMPLAEKPVAAVHGGLTFKIPKNAQWRRIETALGRPKYVITVISGHRLVCFDDLGIQVEVDVNAQHATLTEPEGGDFSSRYASDCATGRLGIQFNASPGDQVHLKLVPQLTPPNQVTGDLAILPFWNISLKDVIVGTELNEQFSLIGLRLITAGTIFLIVGFALLLWMNPKRKI